MSEGIRSMADVYETQTAAIEKHLARIAELEAQLAEREADLERESKPWSVTLCYEGDDYPFAFADLKTHDVGVSDRVYMVTLAGTGLRVVPNA